MLSSYQFSEKERKNIHRYLKYNWTHSKAPAKYKFYVPNQKELIKIQLILIDLGYFFFLKQFKDPIEIIQFNYNISFSVIIYNYTKVIVVVSVDCHTDEEAEDIELEDFLTKYVNSNTKLATHVDQDNYLWRYLLSSDSWECFINNKWSQIDLENHLTLTPFY